MADPLDQILGPAPDAGDRHRYVFVQELLPRWFFRDARFLLADDDIDGLTAELQDLFSRAGDPSEAELDALRAERVDVGTHGGILIALPAPRFPSEAHFVLLLDAPAGPRMLSLERTQDPEGSVGTMLCTRDEAGLRAPAGHDVSPDREAFLAAAARNL